jgi:hypothetical protein
MTPFAMCGSLWASVCCVIDSLFFWPLDKFHYRADRGACTTASPARGPSGVTALEEAVDRQQCLRAPGGRVDSALAIDLFYCAAPEGKPVTP